MRRDDDAYVHPVVFWCASRYFRFLLHDGYEEIRQVGGLVYAEVMASPQDAYKVAMRELYRLARGMGWRVAQGKWVRDLEPLPWQNYEGKGAEPPRKGD